MSEKQPKPKKVSYELIPSDSEIGRPMYALLRSLVAQHHSELREASIGLAWCTSWKADVDGRLTLGKCRKASDLDRELSTFDFVILLNKDFWTSTVVGSDQRMALLDHELCHASISEDEQGDPKVDERDRIVYRIRKHDIEEFTEIVERHGCYKRDLEVFARSVRRAEQSVAGVFVGYTHLQEQLAAAGARIAIEAIVAWTAPQRSDAAVWAFLQRESPLMAPAMPRFIADVATPVEDVESPSVPSNLPEETTNL